MGLRAAPPFRWPLTGLSDTLDGTDTFPGAMASLSNMVPDPSTKGVWQCRPAAQQLTAFAGFTLPGFVSALVVEGDRAYGMVASSRFAGYDEPFCFDLTSNTFVAISGVTAANVPASPSATGSWTPPSIALVGVYLIVAHPGFPATGGGLIGYINIANPAGLTWAAGNTATNALPEAPTWVQQLGDRAYYGCNPTVGQPIVYFSDVLAPLTITNANQSLTFGDRVTLTWAAGLPLNNQLGGIIQSLIVFKGVTNLYQITGDYSTPNNPLTVNSLNVATGTLCPLSVTTTPRGLAFIAPDGLRFIDFSAQVSDPIGISGDGVNVPFLNPVIPSRVAAAFCSNVLRISVQNSNVVGVPTQEYWFDLSRKVWSGPHTFPASLIAPWRGTFVMAPTGITASLWQSDPVQTPTSQFIENGVPMVWTAATSILPDNQQMAESAVIETTWTMGLSAQVSVQALDEANTVLDIIAIQPSSPTYLWNGGLWGARLWRGANINLAPHRILWDKPIVFRRGSVVASGQSTAGFKIGDLYIRYQSLGYTQQGG